MLSREPRRPILPLLISLVVFGVLLMTLDSRSEGAAEAVRARAQAVVAPLQKAAAFVVSPAVRLVESLSDVANLREEIAALRQRLAEAEAARAAVQDELARLELYEQILNMEPAGDDIGRTVAAVIGGAGAFDPALLIDKGLSDGIAPGQPVVDTNGHVVGAVKYVTGGTALVVPIMTERQGLTVTVNDQVGSLTSRPVSDAMRLEILDARSPLLAGDEVRTAAISTRFPTGWSVGAVVEDAAPVNGVVTAGVEPHVDPETLRVVVVLAWPPDPISVVEAVTEMSSTTSTTSTTLAEGSSTTSPGSSTSSTEGPGPSTTVPSTTAPSTTVPSATAPSTTSGGDR